MTDWGTQQEIETRRRIKLAVWAYAYEFRNVSIVDDFVFDFESRMVDLNVRTDRPDLDIWFVCNFDPSTGQWIHKHPELTKVAGLYERFYKC